MASQLKIQVAAGAVSPYLYIGQAQPNYTIYCTGGFGGTLALRSSPVAFIGAEVVSPAPTGIAEFGEKAGGGETVAFTALANGDLVVIRHPLRALQVDNTNGTGSDAVVYILPGL